MFCETMNVEYAYVYLEYVWFTIFHINSHHFCKRLTPGSSIFVFCVFCSTAHSLVFQLLDLVTIILACSWASSGMFLRLPPKFTAFHNGKYGFGLQEKCLLPAAHLFYFVDLLLSSCKLQFKHWFKISKIEYINW